jgi:hypothetical protein
MSDQPTLQTLIDVKPPVSDDALYLSMIRNRGNIAHMAVDLDRSYTTLRKRIFAHPQLLEVYEGIRDEVLDRAETNIFTAVEGGDLQQSQFVLRTLGSKRGWNSRQEITGADGGPVVVNIGGDAAKL